MTITWRPVLWFLAPLSHRGGRVERDTVSPGPSPREGSHLTDRREGKYIPVYMYTNVVSIFGSILYL